jgi:hypothetical protein
MPPRGEGFAGHSTARRLRCRFSSPTPLVLEIMLRRTIHETWKCRDPQNESGCDAPFIVRLNRGYSAALTFGISVIVITTRCAWRVWAHEARRSGRPVLASG